MGVRHEKIAWFRPLDRAKPSDIILRQIRELIVSGIFKPDERLPSERELAERFGVGRGHVREAIKRLEFYGIVKTGPQSGTYVAGLGVRAAEGLFTNILNLEKGDFASLMDTRDILERHAARLAAEKAEDDEIAGIVEAHDEFREEVLLGKDGLEEDMLFHLRIADGSHSPVLRSLIRIMTPEILTLTRDLQVFGGERSRQALKEHEQIRNAIARRDATGAEAGMKLHMEGSRQRGNIQEEKSRKEER
jgi:GntR family transcriptional regulator, transcriptional repressor for pyruvate dehydrogenase complex